MKELVITGGTIINEGRRFAGYVMVCGDRIAEVGEGEFRPERTFSGERIDAADMLVLPGVIDDQVHFREPGLTAKGDIHSESIAAVAGGVTSFMEMPNTRPATVTLDLLEQKYELGAASSLANYAFYLGATNENIAEIRQADPRILCGVKVFMGSSTGNMLVDDEKSLSAIFAESPVPVATHCEDEAIVRRDMERFRQRCVDNITPAMHAEIRSAEACYRSSARAVELADRYGTHLHVLHLSTAQELTLFDAKPPAAKKITNEVCVHHLWFSDADYAEKGNLIKWNPSIKGAEERAGLRAGLLNGKVDVVATDHAPHLLEEKERPYWDCPSGGPLVQHSLAAMLELARQGAWSYETVVEKMSHAPAIRFGVRDRGFLRAGAFADIVIVQPDAPWAVEPENILYKCGWSPFADETFTHRVVYTLINGHVVNRRGRIDTEFRGVPLEFSR